MQATAEGGRRAMVVSLCCELAANRLVLTPKQGVRDENGSDWRSDGKNEAPKPPRKRLAAPVGWNSGPSDSGTPVKASFGDEDEGSSKRSHSRAGSIESNPPSPIDNGWGPIGDPWGPVGASW